MNIKNNPTLVIIDLESEDGSFYPDNKAMGVEHFGFSHEEIKKWVEGTNLEVKLFKTIDVIQKNNKSYPIFFAILSSHLS